MGLRRKAASPASATAVVVSPAPATVLTPSASAPLLFVAVVAAAAASFPAASPASALPKLHRWLPWPGRLACDTPLWEPGAALNGVRRYNGNRVVPGFDSGPVYFSRGRLVNGFNKSDFSVHIFKVMKNNRVYNTNIKLILPKIYYTIYTKYTIYYY